MRGVIRAWVLAVVLACAQQVALAHAVSHFDGEAKEAGQQRLCELHSAMDAVLGAMDTAALAARLEEPGISPVPSPLVGEAGRAAPTPRSRGPPAISPEVKTTVL